MSDSEIQEISLGKSLRNVRDSKKERPESEDSDAAEEDDTFDHGDADAEDEDSELEEGSMEDLLNTFFTNENGDNISDILTGILSCLEKQNSILMKIGSVLNKKS